MNINRVNEILNNKEKCDIYYNNRLVWIQSLNNNNARVGFVDTFEEQDVNINSLTELDINNIPKL